MATILILSFTGEPAQQEETTRQTLFLFSWKTGLDEQHFALHRSSCTSHRPAIGLTPDNLIKSRRADTLWR